MKPPDNSDSGTDRPMKPMPDGRHTPAVDTKTGGTEILTSILT